MYFGGIGCGSRAVCVHPVQVIAIRSTGTVMLKECYENYVKADLVDPVTSKPFKETDVVELVAPPLTLLRATPCLELCIAFG